MNGFFKRSVLFLAAIAVTFILVGLLFAEEGVDLERS